MKHVKSTTTRCQSFKSNEKLFEKVQCQSRLISSCKARYKGKKQKEVYDAIKQDYRSKLKQIIHIQAWYRGVVVRNQYKDLLLKHGKADIKTIQKFLHLLDTNDDDRW